MSAKYFEIYSDLNLNTKNFNNFIYNSLSCTDNENINLQKDINYFQNSFLISIFKGNEHYKISNNDIREIKKLSHIYGNHSIFISCDKYFNEYIQFLFQGKKINLFSIGCDTLFFSNKDKNYKQIDNFLKKFKLYNVIKSSENLSYYLNLKRLSFPAVDLNFPEETLRKIHTCEEKSDFYIGNNFSKENIERLKNSILLKFPYSQETIKEKFILLKSLINVSEKENLPSNNIKKIVNNLSHYNYLETFNYYYYNLLCKYGKIENFKCKNFESIDSAISYSIDLELNNIRGYLIDFRGKFYICYQNNIEIDISNTIDDNKNRVIKEIHKVTSNDYILSQYTLKELINTQIFNKKPYFESSDNLVDENEVLPLELLLNKGNNMYNITGKLLNFKNKKYLTYDRKDFNLHKIIEINLIEKIDTYYTIIVKLEDTYITLDEDFYIPSKEEDFKRGISKSMNKGYLMTDAGLIRYTTTSELKIEDIEIPDWFKSTSDKEFLFLLNFFQHI